VEWPKTTTLAEVGHFSDFLTFPSLNQLAYRLKTGELHIPETNRLARQLPLAKQRIYAN